MEQDSFQRIRKITEYVLMFVTAGISVIIAVLDLAGLLDANSWITQRMPTLTLLGVGFIASYLILERRGKLDELYAQGTETLQRVSSSVSDIIHALQGVEVKVFNDGGEFFRYFRRRVQSAKRVDDVKWGEDVPPTSGQELEEYRRYYDVVTEVASKPDVRWREIVMFIRRSHFERIKPYLTVSIPGYSVKFYYAISEMPPRFTFAIVDSKEVFLASHNLRLAIRHDDIVQYFERHYENLWGQGKELKIGNTINQEEIEKLTDTL